jgi:hypothetical protein
MAFKREHLVEWLASEAPGETLVSYAVTGFGGVAGTNPGSGLTAGSSSGIERREAFAESLSPATHHIRDTTFHALTDRRLILGTRSGMRNRPKDRLHSAPIEQVTVHWFDDDEGGGNRFRHFVTDFGDGTIRSDRSGLTVMGRATKSNADAFLEALGDRARPMPTDDLEGT